ncbi:endolytic transglycosylase MltG [Couchioplanes caeruleus]|uniref:endolytic transglycosylase MltG n=1 Tax=Couchioplanes caeruleus TaxID=56438 RepID=UPI00201BBCA8|nr:endolytic transglycosylase MltG [Couchioplanes caeruleus]UQU67188.1 endolytic transglycosylase MltG [Couchioplanes caeruleus]
MIDELDLAFDEQAEKGKPRHRRGRGGGKGGKGKSAVAFLMVFILLGVLGVGGYLGYEKIKGFFTAADYDGSGTDPVQVSLAKGSLTEIGNTLVDADVVKSTAAFTQAAEDNPRGKNIQPGTYNLRKQMSAKDAVTLLLDPKARVSKGVTIKEGLTAQEIYATLSKATKVPVKDFETAAKDPQALGVPDFWFNRRDNKKASGTIEGFLFPDTYEFDPKATAADMLRVMVGKFIDTTTDIGFVKTAEGKLSVSPYEALIVASLSQAESGTAEDLPKVARVAYNRAYKKNMPLQFDVTTNYWLQLQDKSRKHSGKMSDAELKDPKNPYTTELKVGLPLGPINNPGKAALEAAVKPAVGDWLFFVAIDPKTKKSAFAVTNAEHDANIQKACRNGVPLC